MKVTAKFEPRDLWVGLFWKYVADKPADHLDVYICLVPCLPIKVSIPMLSQDYRTQGQRMPPTTEEIDATIKALKQGAKAAKALSVGLSKVFTLGASNRNLVLDTERQSKLSPEEVDDLLAQSAKGVRYLREQLRKGFRPPPGNMRFR